jgi:DtxR family transcriptional regulator, Mn-dependent transcriptional regulator
VSAPREDYVRAIYLLEEAHGPVAVTKLAGKLGLNKSTVSERVKDLAAVGLVVAQAYSRITLTPAGRSLAEKLTYKHRIIEVFLSRILKMPKTQIHDEAERLEHAFGDEAIKRLADFLDHPECDPHGTAIPVVAEWAR